MTTNVEPTPIIITGPNPTYTSYLKMTDVTLDAADMTNVIAVTAAAVDELGGWAYFIERQASMGGAGNTRLVSCKLDGTSMTQLYKYLNPYSLGIGPIAHQSNDGRIQVWADGTSIYISSAGALLSPSPISLGSIIMPNIGFAISPTGAYIVIVGPNSTDQNKAQLQVWHGV